MEYRTFSEAVVRLESQAIPVESPYCARNVGSAFMMENAPTTSALAAAYPNASPWLTIKCPG